MVKLDIHPKDWTNTKVYDHYISQIDGILTPDEQFDESLDTLFELAQIYECDIKEVFLFMEANDIIRLVQAKKLSPWLILHSRQFHKFINTEMTREQRILLEQYINPSRWGIVFSKFPTETLKFKQKVNKLKL
jgi:hypothetical protein